MELPFNGEDVKRNVELVQFKNGQTPPRPYLGMSNCGEECLRKRWYDFRWVKRVTFTARELRLFKRGHREEPYIIDALRGGGYKVTPFDPGTPSAPKTGQQFEVMDCHGHAKGHTDGKIELVENIAGLLEMKTHAEKYFRQLVKHGVEKAHNKHYCQMQRYMGKQHLPYALYVAVCKNNDAYYMEIVYYNETVDDLLTRKDEAVILSDEPLERISEDPFWYKCGQAWCPYGGLCHFGEEVDANCRTCQHGVIKEDGIWFCDERNCNLSVPEQRKTCADYTKLESL